MNNGWDNWGKHVLSELGRPDPALQRIEARQIKMLQAISGLKVKAGIWGGLAGVIPSLIALSLSL